MQNSEYNPQMWHDVQAIFVKPKSIGLSGSVGAGGTTNVDLTLTDDMLIRGVEMFCNNIAFGDKVSVSVLAGAAVVGTPITDWALSTENKFIKYDAVAPMKLVAGLKLRFTYTSALLLGLAEFKINLNMLEILK